MSPFNIFKRVSQAPTNPRKNPASKQFDISELYRGPIQTEADSRIEDTALDEKLRQAYFWLVNNAIISPHYDIEYNDGPSQNFSVGDSKRTLSGDMLFVLFNCL